MMTGAESWMIAQLKEIYQLSFGDSEDYTNLFFQTLFSLQNCLVDIEDGRPVSMMLSIPVQLTKGDGNMVDARYYYAVATHPDYRGQGIVTKLMEYADGLARQQGAEAVVLRPGSKRLFHFYAERGYQVGFSIREAKITRLEVQRARSCTLYELPCADFKRIRSNWSSMRPMHFLWREQELETVYQLLYAAGEEILSLERKEFSAQYVVCLPREQDVLIREMMVAPEYQAEMVRSVLDRYERDQCVVWLPTPSFLFAGKGKVTKFGMIKFLRGQHPAWMNTRDGYMNLTIE